MTLTHFQSRRAIIIMALAHANNQGQRSDGLKARVETDERTDGRDRLQYVAR